MDRLVAVLLFIFFRFYEENVNSPPRIAVEVMKRADWGLARWQNGLCTELDPSFVSRRFNLDYLSTAYRCQKHDDVGRISAVCGFDAVSGRERCSCDFFITSGKRCQHLWAMVFLIKLGPHDEYEEEMTTLDKVLEQLQVPAQKLGEEYGTKESELAEYFGVDESTLTDWDLLDMKAEDGRTVYSGLHPAGRPPQLVPIRKDRSTKVANPVHLRAIGNRGPPPGTRNPGTACWVNSLAVAVAFSGTAAEAFCEGLNGAADTQKAVLPWLEPLVQHFELLRKPAVKYSLNSERLQRAACDSVGGSVKTQEDPNLVLRLLLTQLEDSGITHPSELFRSIQLLTRTCAECGASVTTTREGPCILLTITDMQPTLGLEAQKTSEFFRCPDCDATTDDNTADSTTFLLKPQIVWFEVGYAAHELAYSQSDPLSTPSVDIPEIITLPSSPAGAASGAEAPDSQRSETYELRASLWRQGRTDVTGHNTAVVKRGERLWHVDDSIVNPIASLAHMKKRENAHITAAFYVRKELALETEGTTEKTPATKSTAAGSKPKSSRGKSKAGDSRKAEEPSGTGQESTQPTDESPPAAPEQSHPRSVTPQPVGSEPVDPEPAGAGSSSAISDYGHPLFRTERWAQFPKDHEKRDNNPFYPFLNKNPTWLKDHLWADVNDPMVVARLSELLDPGLELERPPIASIWFWDMIDLQELESLAANCYRLLKRKGQDTAVGALERAWAGIRAITGLSTPNPIPFRGTIASFYNDECISVFVDMRWLPVGYLNRVKARYLFWNRRFTSSDRGGVVPYKGSERRSLPCHDSLGDDGPAWRERVSIIPLQIEPHHYGVAVVHGPRRLIMWYDGYGSSTGGRYENVSV